jgi:predicted nucleic acid-binding protein
MDETITLLFRWLPFETAKTGLERIEKAAREGYLRLERITQDRFEKAKRLRLKFRDKPLISFTDLTSMVVMQERRLKQILTEDDHFTHVGMGLERVP